jgi:hypothetical protein
MYLVHVVDVLCRRNGLAVVVIVLRVDVPRVKLSG